MEPPGRAGERSAVSLKLHVRKPPLHPRKGLGTLYKIGISPLVPEQYQIASADFVLDTTKAKKNLGFTPKKANRDGLIEAWHWWMKRNATESGVRGILKSWKPKHQNALQKRKK